MRMVRIATEDDYDEIARLIEELFPDKAMKTDKEDIYFVAEVNGAIAGFAHAVLTPRRVALQGIGVAENMRGAGIGTLLLDRVIAYCKEIGQPEICLRVKALNPAARMYAKKGFVVRRFGSVCSLTRREAT
jgi:N-acetylglutamate synthase-like GNAT family acetyltransferase